MTEMIRLVACPTCRSPAPWTKNNHWKPFCSERCKLIDLGAWVNEKYQIAGEETSSDSSSDETTAE